MANVTFLWANLGPNESTFWGGHTHLCLESGLNVAFSSKSANIGQKPGFSGPGSQKHRFLEVRRNALYNRWLAGSIGDAFRSAIALFKNSKFLGVFGAFLTEPKSGHFTDSMGQSVYRLPIENEND